MRSRAKGGVAAEGTPREVLRPDLLGEAFGTPVHVETRPDGTPFVAPAAGLEDRRPKKEDAR